MIKKTAAALAALALASVLVGCNNSDDCYDDEATGAGIELVALVDGKSGGSSGGGSRGGGSKPGSKAKPGKGVGAGVAAGMSGHDDCDDD